MDLNARKSGLDSFSAIFFLAIFVSVCSATEVDLSSPRQQFLSQHMLTAIRFGWPWLFGRIVGGFQSHAFYL